MVKALDLDLAGSLQKQLRPEHVRAGEEARIDDGQTVVRLGGEVDDDLDLVLAEDVFDDVEIGDVGLDERNVGAFEIRPVSGVGQKVERDDAVVRVLPEPVVDEVRPDETGRAGDEDPHGVIVRGASTSPSSLRFLQSRRAWSISFRCPCSSCERSRCGSASSQRPSWASASPRSYSA